MINNCCEFITNVFKLNLTLPGRAKARWNTKLFLYQTGEINPGKQSIKHLKIESS